MGMREGFLDKFLQVLMTPPIKAISRIWQYRVGTRFSKNSNSEIYWSRHTVPVNSNLKTETDSIDFFLWRCGLYPDYLKLMPVNQCDGKVVLDYGCGPGHDLAGILHFSAPKKIVALDVSEKALEIAKSRISLHSNGNLCEFILIKEGIELSMPDNYFDYIHSSGVLHHVQNLELVLSSFHKILKDDGTIRIMIYNRNSLWYHLYAPYVLQIKRRLIPRNLDSDEAFRMSTDGPLCPISRAFTYRSFSDICKKAGFSPTFLGTSLSRHEILIYNKYGERALRDEKLAKEHRDFLMSINTKDDNLVLPDGTLPGINLVLELRKS
jgi:SAM-dependent methyltransferase